MVIITRPWVNPSAFTHLCSLRVCVDDLSSTVALVGTANAVAVYGLEKNVPETSLVQMSETVDFPGPIAAVACVPWEDVEDFCDEQQMGRDEDRNGNGNNRDEMNSLHSRPDREDDDAIERENMHTFLTRQRRRRCNKDDGTDVEENQGLKEGNAHEQDACREMSASKGIAGYDEDRNMDTMSAHFKMRERKKPHVQDIGLVLLEDGTLVLMKYEFGKLTVMNRYKALEKLSEDPAKFLTVGHGFVAAVSKMGRRGIFKIGVARSNGSRNNGQNRHRMSSSEFRSHRNMGSELKLQQTSTQEGYSCFHDNMPSSGWPTTTALWNIFEHPYIVSEIGIVLLPLDHGVCITVLGIKVLSGVQESEYEGSILFYRCTDNIAIPGDSYNQPIRKICLETFGGRKNKSNSFNQMSMLLSSRLTSCLILQSNAAYVLSTDADETVLESIALDMHGDYHSKGMNLSDIMAFTELRGLERQYESRSVSLIAVDSHGKLYSIEISSENRYEEILPTSQNQHSNLCRSVVSNFKVLARETGQTSGCVAAIAHFASEDTKGLFALSVEGDLSFLKLMEFSGRDKLKWSYVEQSKLIGGGPLIDACLALNPNDFHCSSDNSPTRDSSKRIERKTFLDIDDIVIMGIKSAASKNESAYYNLAGYKASRGTEENKNFIHSDRFYEKDVKKFSRIKSMPSNGELLRISRNYVPDVLFCSSPEIAEGTTAIYPLRRSLLDDYHSAVIISSTFGSRIMTIEGGVFQDISELCRIDCHQETLAAGSIASNWIVCVNHNHVVAFRLPEIVSKSNHNGLFVSKNGTLDEEYSGFQSWVPPVEGSIIGAAVVSSGLVLVHVTTPTGRHEIWAIASEEFANEAKENQSSSGFPSSEQRSCEVSPSINHEPSNLKLVAIAMIPISSEASCISCIIPEPLETDDVQLSSNFIKGSTIDKYSSLLFAVGTRSSSIMLMTLAKKESKICNSSPSPGDNFVASMSLIIDIPLTNLAQILDFVSPEKNGDVAVDECIEVSEIGSGPRSTTAEIINDTKFENIQKSIHPAEKIPTSVILKARDILIDENMHGSSSCDASESCVGRNAFLHITASTRGGDVVTIPLFAFDSKAFGDQWNSMAYRYSDSRWAINPKLPPLWLKQGREPAILHPLEHLSRHSNPKYDVVAVSDKVCLLRTPIIQDLEIHENLTDLHRIDQLHLKMPAPTVAACPLILRCEEELCTVECEKRLTNAIMRTDMRDTESTLLDHEKDTETSFYKQLTMISCTQDGRLILLSLEAHQRSNKLSAPLGFVPTSIFEGGLLFPNMLALGGYVECYEANRKDEYLYTERFSHDNKESKEATYHRAKFTESKDTLPHQRNVEEGLVENDADSHEEIHALSDYNSETYSAQCPRSGNEDATSFVKERQRYLEIEIINTKSNQLVAKTEKFSVPTLLGDNEFITSIVFLPRDMYLSSEERKIWYSQPNVRQFASNSFLESDTGSSKFYFDEGIGQERNVRQRLESRHSCLDPDSSKEPLKRLSKSLKRFQKFPCRVVVGCAETKLNEVASSASLSGSKSKCALNASKGRIIVFECFKCFPGTDIFILEVAGQCTTEGPVTSLSASLSNKPALGQGILDHYVFAGVGNAVLHFAIQSDLLSSEGQKDVWNENAIASLGKYFTEKSPSLSLSKCSTNECADSQVEREIQHTKTDTLDERSLLRHVGKMLVNILASRLVSPKCVIFRSKSLSMNSHVLSLEMYPGFRPSTLVTLEGSGVVILQQDNNQDLKVQVNDDCCKAIAACRLEGSQHGMMEHQTSSNISHASEFLGILDEAGCLRIFRCNDTLQLEDGETQCPLPNKACTIAQLDLYDSGLTIKSHCQENPIFGPYQDLDLWTGRIGNELRTVTAITRNGGATQLLRFPHSNKYTSFSNNGHHYLFDFIILYQQILKEYRTILADSEFAGNLSAQMDFFHHPIPFDSEREHASPSKNKNDYYSENLSSLNPPDSNAGTSLWHPIDTMSHEERMRDHSQQSMEGIYHSDDNAIVEEHSSKLSDFLNEIRTLNKRQNFSINAPVLNGILVTTFINRCSFDIKKLCVQQALASLGVMNVFSDNDLYSLTASIIYQMKALMNPSLC